MKRDINYFFAFHLKKKTESNIFSTSLTLAYQVFSAITHATGAPQSFRGEKSAGANG